MDAEKLALATKVMRLVADIESLAFNIGRDWSSKDRQAKERAARFRREKDEANRQLAELFGMRADHYKAAP